MGNADGNVRWPGGIRTPLPLHRRRVDAMGRYRRQHTLRHWPHTHGVAEQPQCRGGTALPLEQCCQDILSRNRHWYDGSSGSAYRYGNRRARRRDAVLDSADGNDQHGSQVSAALQEGGRELPGDWQLGMGRHTQLFALHKFAHRHRPGIWFLQLRGSLLLESSHRRRSCRHGDAVEDGHRGAGRLECNRVIYRSRAYHPGLDLAVYGDRQRYALRVPSPRIWHQLAGERRMVGCPRFRTRHDWIHFQLTQQLNYRSRIAFVLRRSGCCRVSVSDDSCRSYPRHVDRHRRRRIHRTQLARADRNDQHQCKIPGALQEGQRELAHHWQLGLG